MDGLSRRRVLGVAGLAVAAGTGAAASAMAAPGSRTGIQLIPRQRRPAAAGSRIAAENARSGLPRWHRPQRAVDDVRRQVQGYASRTSVAAGRSIDLHLTAAGGRGVVIDILRLGHYGGARARLVHRSPPLTVAAQQVPVAGPHGLVHCNWPVAYRYQVPATALSGAYIARFRAVDGSASYHPFVVRDDHRDADFCVVLPTSTYQAYNRWPRDGRTGCSLYYGYGDDGLWTPDRRAREVSYDRPYSQSGLPARFDSDLDGIDFLEHAGYDLVYATDEDLHSGALNPARYQGLIFVGHDEYWSTSMRRRVTAALTGGTSLVFLGANNVYWHIRYGTGRVISCFKGDPDPAAGGGAATDQWRRRRGPGAPEQHLLGAMYNGIPVQPAPLVVRRPGHWFWRGTGVGDGVRIPAVVGGEADGFFPDVPVAAVGRHTLLSSSPYEARQGGTRIQNTSLRELPGGQLVFLAGSLQWTHALSRRGVRDERIVSATRNLLDRIRAAR